MKKLVLGMFLACGLMLSSCGDDNGPTLTITSPSNGDILAVSGIMLVSGSAVDDTEITSIGFTGSTGFGITGSVTLDPNADNSTVNFLTEITLDASIVAGDYTLTFEAVDNDGNTDTKEIEVKIQ